MVVLTLLAAAALDVVRVENVDAFRQAVARAKPGTQILLAPGEYAGGIHLSEIHGRPERPILIGAAEPDRPPRFVGGGSGLQFSDVSHLEIRDLTIVGARENGINVDDGGTYTTPSHHLVLRRLQIEDLPQGNHDGIKLSGVDDFQVLDCWIRRWGGSGIDMVGCHRGVIDGGDFRDGGDNAIQTKGGSADVLVRRCRFGSYGQRGVNIGGSTGIPFFRPPLSQVPEGRRYEAKNIRVEGCIFVGGSAPFAFVGVDGATVRFNTVYQTQRWAIRILQETQSPDFVPCRNGVFERNLIVFRADAWASGGVNVGPKTAPETFRFDRNFWFCEDRPDASRPTLPTPDAHAVIGRDPRFTNPAQGDLTVATDSPARSLGAHAYTAGRP